jgi:hypothetical protein
MRRKRLFTVASANRALVFVRRVAQDIVDHYEELTDLRALREDLSLTNGMPEQIAELRGAMQRQIDTLHALRSELTAVGCEVKDWSLGLIDFPALREGREVNLCWRLGEPEVLHWHERDAGFSGRRPIDDLFDDPDASSSDADADAKSPAKT